LAGLFIKNREIVSRKDIQFFALYLFIVLVSMLNSPDAAVSVKYLKKFILCIFLYLAVFQCSKNEKYAKGIIFFMIACAVVCSIDGIFQYFNGFDWFSSRAIMRYPHLGINRITGPFHQSGVFGIFLGFVLPLIISFFISFGGLLKRILLGLCILLLLTALFLTYAPGAVLGLIAACIVFSILFKRYLFLGILAVIIIAGFAALPSSLTEWPNGSFYTSITGRVSMWKTAVDIFMAHPLIGSGAGSFPVVYNDLCVPGQPHCQGGAPYAHNQYIQTLAETGILGFLLLYIFVFNKMIGACQSYKNHDLSVFKRTAIIGILGSMTAFLVHGFLESSIYTYHGSLLFWAGLGLVGGMTVRTSENKY